MCDSWIFSVHLVLPFLKGFLRSSLAPGSIPNQLHIYMYSPLAFCPQSAVGTSEISLSTVKTAKYSLASLNIYFLKLSWCCTIILPWTCSFLKVSVLILLLSFSLSFALSGGLRTQNSVGQKLVYFYWLSKVMDHLTEMPTFPIWSAEALFQAFWIALWCFLSLLTM